MRGTHLRTWARPARAGNEGPPARSREAAAIPGVCGADGVLAGSVEIVVGVILGEAPEVSGEVKSQRRWVVLAHDDGHRCAARGVQCVHAVSEEFFGQALDGGGPGV
jgi:hypothetical protein